MLFRAALVSAFALAGLFAAAPEASARPGFTNPRAWVIGPIIGGRNYSRGTPLHPTPGPGGAWHINVPPPPGKLGYVTFRHGPLTGKSRIVMRYRVEVAPGARILAASNPQQSSMITLYFQRAGDDWSAAGPFEAYRWYATFATQAPITPGEHVMVAPLSGNWTAVETSSARTNPRAFREALANADQVGFVLGGGDGYGHGVFATGPARLVVTDFRVE